MMNDEPKRAKATIVTTYEGDWDMVQQLMASEKREREKRYRRQEFENFINGIADKKHKRKKR
jgi:hypothetical protein